MQQIRGDGREWGQTHDEWKNHHPYHRECGHERCTLVSPLSGSLADLLLH